MILIDHDKCVGCGLCVSDCIGYNLKLQDGKAVARRECFLCGHCVAICPAGAVSIPEYDMEDVESYDKDLFHIDPEKLLRTIKYRRSIRDYHSTKLTEEELKLLLQAGRYTATAKNVQDCTFVFVQDALEELKELVWGDIERREASDAEVEAMKPYYSFNRRRKADPKDDYLFRNAPAVLFVTSEWPLNAGLAAQNVETMAAAMGLGVMYNGYLCRIADSHIELKTWLGIEEKTIRACLLLGHPNRHYVRTAPRAQANVIWK